MVKCNTCGGVYEQTMPDGTRYFHACPPLSVPEIKAQLQQGTLQLSAADAKRLSDAQADDTKTPVAAGATSRADVVLSSLIIERPNKRDENIAGVAAPGQPAPQKAPGNGVTKM